MKIAEVIVDLKSKSIDKTFSYSIPERFLSVAEIGERCFVQFGNQRRMGFIVNIIDENVPSSKLKDIDDIIDIEPIITKELIDLAFELSKTSLYPIVSYLLTMIPASLKVNYSKRVRLINKDDFRLNLIFNGKEELNYNKLDKFDLQTIKDAIASGDVEVVQNIDRQESIKQEKYVKLISSPDKLTEKRRLIVEYLKNNNLEVRWFDLRDNLKVSLETIKRMEELGIVSISEREVYRKIETLKPLKDKKVNFNIEQLEALAKLSSGIGHNEVFLLHGITGSGKTEIYLNLIEKVIDSGKEAILLVPEISLTPMMVNRFKSRFSDKVAIFHSELSADTRYDEWRKVLRGEVKIAVGARSAIFVPFKNLGMIIMDEEHEQSYKQDNSPLYHARDVAERRAKINNCPLILGSATPSIESYARALKEVYTLVELKHRANNLGLPETLVVDLNQEFKRGMKGSLSTLLINEIQTRLDRKEQSLLLLNRRGYSNFVLCRACGYIEQCPNCDVSLTYHDYDKTLKCHYCGYEKPVIHSCPKCSSTYLDFRGTGTEKVVEELNELFPTAKVVRMDNDTTRGKNGHEKVLYEFENDGDILVGTQMIAKGLDFPNVTLVGIINADQSLSIPDFRSKETTFELLTQVSGRAGRGSKPGLVVLQTYNKDHYVIKYGLKQDYIGFYLQEMKVRKLAKFVPYYFMTNIKIKAPELNTAYTSAFKIKQKLLEIYKNGEVIVLGPLQPTIARLENQYIFNVIVKYKIVPTLDNVLKNIFEENISNDVLISIDRFPTSF